MFDFTSPITEANMILHQRTRPGADAMTPKTKPAADAQRNALLLEIAERHLFVETLETRNSDRLDFHEHAVWVCFGVQN